MMSTTDRLIYMANQIARELGSQHPGTAVEATWDHLWHFWDPAMRRTIITHLEAGGDGLGDVARRAVAMLRDRGTSALRMPATETPSPAGGGSDAG